MLLLTLSEMWGGWGKESLPLPPGFFYLPLPSVPEILRCVECTWHQELSLQPHIVLLAGLERTALGRHSRSAGKYRGEWAQQPAGHMSAQRWAEWAGPWTRSTNHSLAVTENRLRRRGENLFASWDQNIMVSVYLFTCWQDSAFILSSNTSKGEEIRNLLRTRDHFLQPLNFKRARFRKWIWCLWYLSEPQMKRGNRKALSGKPDACTKTWYKTWYWLLPKVLQTWMCMQSPKYTNTSTLYKGHHKGQQ